MDGILMIITFGLAVSAFVMSIVALNKKNK